MRLLVITQKVDKKDPILGFFHGWILKLSEKFEKISVICLENGDYDLPENVKVFSLGKEFGKNKIKYVANLYRHILGLYADYDAVFVHMNQEYIILGGFLWKIMGKRVYLWRNHLEGNIFTRVAVWLSNKVFCTSKFAFVAKYKKTSLMPVGIDTSVFNTKLRIKNYELCKNKILFLSRMSPVKKPELLIESLNILKNRGVDFTCDFHGDPLSKDEDYYNSLKTKVKEFSLENKINFYKSVPNYETPKIYNEHEIFVNLTPSGSFDKTILEAAACGCIPVITNKSLSGDIDEKMITKKETPEAVAQALDFWLNAGNEQKKDASIKLQKYVSENHSLNSLVDKLSLQIK